MLGTCNFAVAGPIVWNSLQVDALVLSHSGTECFKDDNASQWKSGKLIRFRSPKAPEPIVT